jgi:hypothetical protein
MRAFLAGLRGTYGTVRLGPADKYGIPVSGSPGNDFLLQTGLMSSAWQTGNPPYGGAQDARLSAPGGLNARSVSLTMPAARQPRRGNYIGIGNALHLVTAVNGTGPYVCSIEPGLRDDYPANTFVVFDGPQCTMRLATPVDSFLLSGDTMVVDLTLDFVEAF